MNSHASPKTSCKNLIEAELLDANELLAVMPFSRASLYAWSHSGAFPAPIRLGHQRFRWRRADVNAWLEARGLPLLPAPDAVTA